MQPGRHERFGTKGSFPDIVQEFPWWINPQKGVRWTIGKAVVQKTEMKFCSNSTRIQRSYRIGSQKACIMEIKSIYFFQHQRKDVAL